ncbi:hypothetical protein RHGRI_021302 [Rhododendron griersonianum]|uniref:Beta-glucosidase n=1 Tax=Rhododendron griersonianum TaxID=479676 RepID=A0AAV6JLM9_9ERIC|nr:hypothetical protein RHGRI_021302 [Rhododendron griersonianum]
MTFYEPRVVAALGYDDGFFAPGRCSKAYGTSATEPYIVSHNLILSHAVAVQRYREKYQENLKFLATNKTEMLHLLVRHYPPLRRRPPSPSPQKKRSADWSTGMDDPGNVTLPKGLHDTTRKNYYKAYITQLKRAIDDGANVEGYFAWSLLDNFEWRLGYTSRFGIVYVDYKTLKHYPKMSAYWFEQLLSKNKH